MAEAPNISYAGSSAVATAVRVTTILTTAIQAIGDVPDDVRQVLNRVQEVRAAILRLPNPMQLSPAATGAQWPRDWLTEAHRAIDATAAETGGLHMRLSDWDNRRNARQIRMTWDAFHAVIPAGLLDTASRRIESAKNAIEILISAVDITSTPEINAQIERTRNIISQLLTDQQVVEAPAPSEPPPPYSPHVGRNGNVPTRRGTPGFNNSVGYVLVQYPNGTVGAAAAPQFVHSPSFPIPARRRSSEQIGYFQNPTPTATPVEGSTAQNNSELVALKQEAATLRQEAAVLRQEVATLRDEAAALRQEAIAIKQENTTLKREAIVLKQDMATLKEEAATLKEEAAALKQEAAALKAESASKDVKLAELAVEVTSLKSRRDSVLAANSDPQDDILQRVISKYKNVKRLYFDSQKDIVELKKEVEQLKQQDKAAKSKDEVIEKWKEECEKLEKQVKEQGDAERAVNEWKEKYDALVEEHNSVQESMARSLEEVHAERDRLARDLDATRDGLGSHEAELEATRTILANTQNMLDERENRLASSMAAADGTRVELEHKLEDRTRRLEEVEHERATVYDFVRRLSQLGLDASRFLDETHSAATSAS